MSKDIQFIHPETGPITPSIKGIIQTPGLKVYQKLMVLLLSSSSSAYRERAGVNLIDLLKGANAPPDVFLEGLGRLACSNALNLLDPEDFNIIESLNAETRNGRLIIILKLINGQTYTGVII